MTTPQQPSPWSTKGLQRLATSFVAQEHVGVLGGLLLRLARFLQGDPSSPITVSSAAGSPQQLPDNTPALSAVFIVAGAPILFRVDGQNPTAADGLLPVGAVVTLTGQPTIKGWRFVTASAVTATLTGSFYD